MGSVENLGLAQSEPRIEQPSDRRIGRRPLHEEVIDQLRDRIVQGELAPGTRLNERVLCEQLGISRTPLREAIKMLATEGLVELLPNRGAIVTLLKAETIAETPSIDPMERSTWRAMMTSIWPIAPIMISGVSRRMMRN